MKLVMAYLSTGRDNIEDLPNLKIEIENDFDIPMETDDDILEDKHSTASTETEEGELVDDDDEEMGLDRNVPITVKIKPNIKELEENNLDRSIVTYETPKEEPTVVSEKLFKNRNGSFVTGVNIFDPEEQAKLNKRATRFNIDPSETKSLTDKQLKKLYRSMGVKQNDDNIRLETLHMRGTKGMDTQQVFAYFKDYGPASLEWITENSCNVVWLDDISAARALLGLSVPIKGLPFARPKVQSDSESEVDMSQPVTGKSDSEMSEESDAISSSEVPMTIPKGQWRLGKPTPNSQCILLRFATTQDRSTPRNDFYSKNFQNPDNPGYVGLISESRKRRIQGAFTNVIFEDVGDEILRKPANDDGDNPWGSLAKSWGHFEKLKPSTKPKQEHVPPHLVKPPHSISSLTLRPAHPERKKLVARTKLRREVQDQRDDQHKKANEASDSDEDGSSESDWNSRKKMPRMRMHADDEEVKAENRRKKTAHRNRSRSKSPKRNKDLRERLQSKDSKQIKKESTDSSSEEVEEEDEKEDDDDIPDLRIAVPADRDGPKDSKIGVRESLFQAGKYKSVLRGARTHSSGDEDNNSEDELRRMRSSIRRHRSRSRERRHHRSPRDETDTSSRHRTRRQRDLRSTIQHRSLSVDNDSDEVVTVEGRQDLRTKLNKKNKNDKVKPCRSKSPLQIEIDNDEYYKLIESD